MQKLPKKILPQIPPNQNTALPLPQLPIGLSLSLRMQSSLITTTPLRKVTEYVVSTLLILRKSQTKNIALTIAQPQALNTRSLNQTTTTQTTNQNSTRGIKIQMYISLPLHLLKIYGQGHERARHLELHSHRLYGEKTRSLESRIARKCKKNQHL